MNRVIQCLWGKHRFYRQRANNSALGPFERCADDGPSPGRGRWRGADLGWRASGRGGVAGFCAAIGPTGALARDAMRERASDDQ